MTTKAERNASLVDNYNRRIDYLRVSVTDKCNLQCVYCVSGRMDHLASRDLLTSEEIVGVVRGFIEAGGKKVRLTGGEPLMREDLEALIQSLTALPGLEVLTLTTNGTMLAQRAAALGRAGLRHINVSLDTLNPERFRTVSCSVASPEMVIDGIREVVRQGFRSVKINVVAMRGVNDEEIADFVRLGLRENATVRFIEYMPLGDKDKWRTRYFPAVAILERIKEMLKDGEAAFQEEGGPARYYQLKEGGEVGIISPVSHGFCDRCNRLRLMSDGTLIPCLLSNKGFSLREIQGGMHNPDALKNAFREAVLMKGRQGDFEKASHKIRLVGG